MYEVPHSVPRSRPWLLAILWLGIAAANLEWTRRIYPLLYSLTGVANSNILLMSSGIAVLSGLPAIILQWLALRRFFARMHGWVPVFTAISVADLLLQGVLFRFAGDLLASFGISRSSTHLLANAPLDALIAVTMAWALLPGFAGWWLFRPSTRRAWLWPAALLLGRLGETLVTLMMLWPILDSGRMNLTVYGQAYAAASLLAAAIQAAVLVVFLRERARPAVAAPAQGE
jgi:hypothetical protein